jgi:general secretion pathway protein D
VDPSRDAQQSSVAPGILAFTGLFTDGQVQTVMRGLSQKKGVDIMARPSTITRSGQQSTVEMVQEFMYPTEYEPPEVPTNVNNSGNAGAATPVTPAMPTAFESRPVGVELQVLPMADPEKRYVEITLQPSFVKFDGFVNFGSPITTAVPNLLGGATVQELTENAILMPVFSVQRTTTQLTIADGATVVFGGLLTDRIQQGQDKVPVLGQLPMLGRFFTSTSSQPITTAIIFMVQVELIDPTGRPYRDR